MKSKLVFSILIVCMVMAIIASNATAAPTHSFTLTATGKAYDPTYHVWRTVSLTTTGTALGANPSKYLDFYPKGSLTVQKWGTFSLVSGWGILMSRVHYIMLNIRIILTYGGSTAWWNMKDSTGSWDGNKLPITLSASRICLPLQVRPTLTSLTLTGTITIN